MAILNSSEVKFKGAVFQNKGTYSRLHKIEIDKKGVILVFHDYASVEAAEKVMRPVRPRVAPDYDPKNPIHKAQYEAAGKPDLNQLDADGNPWRPTVSDLIWDGETCKEKPLTERRVVLSEELAAKYLAANTLSYDDAIAQAYIVAMASGEFLDAEAV